MNNKIAVELQYGEIIAIVTYHYRAPFLITPNFAGRETTYTTQVEGEELTFETPAKILDWLEKARPIIAIPAAISNIEFLSAEYHPKALKIYGSDFRTIEAELAKVPPKKYENAEEMLFACCPNYDY